MTADEMRRVAEFVEGLMALARQTGLTVNNDYLWDESHKMICGIDSSYQIRTV